MNNYGGKANSLIKLKQNGINVPKFYIFSSEDYLEFLKYNNLIEEITKLSENKEYLKIKEKILNSDFSKEQKEKIYNGYEKINSELVSVRSSANNEDGTEKSFAGQYETYLYVSKANLLEKIKYCLSSVYLENVTEYDEKKEIASMNVIIQEMIDADYSGVAFSVDPTRSDNNYTVIDITKGVGEKLVSGEITPTKYLIRRETKKIDLKTGDIDIQENIIEELENTILKIEKIYNTRMDIEYAIKNNNIYILQARPITAITPAKKIFFLSISRPMSLIKEKIYFEGEYNGIKELTRGLYYFKPLFMYNIENKNIDIYYNKSDLEEDPRLIYYYMDLDYEIIVKRFKKIKENIKYINNIVDNELEIDIKEYLKKIFEIYPFSSLGQLAGHYGNITVRIKEILLEYRNNYDYIIEKAVEYLLYNISKNIDNKFVKYIDYITIEEYINNEIPNIEELEKRKKGYIYYDELIVTTDYLNVFKENNILIEEVEKTDENAILKGEMAFPGEAKGRVCKVFSKEDFEKFEEGDILVTPMTTPKFMKVIKKCSGIITDEGGITCHASIISREWKKPCIVGCKNATKILENGEIIRIIEGKIERIKNK